MAGAHDTANASGTRRFAFLERLRRKIHAAAAIPAKTLGALQAEVWAVEGRESVSHAPLTLVVAAPPPSRAYLAATLFAEAPRETLLGRRWLWRIESAASRLAQRPDAIFIEAGSRARRFLLGGDWLAIPRWVQGEAPLDGGRRLPKSLKSDLSRIRRNNLTYSVSRDPERFEAFYREMYAPYIAGAHGASAFVIPYDAFRNHLPACELLVVQKEGRDIAGILLDEAGGLPRLWTLGIRDGDPAHLDDGAMAALYHFAFERFRAQGHKTAITGLSRAFLRDGALRYKRKWGQRITGRSPVDLALRVCRDAPGARALLAHHPFIFEAGGAFYAAIAWEAPIFDADKLLSDLRHDGIARVFVFHTGPAPAYDGVDLILRPFSELVHGTFRPGAPACPPS